MGERLGAPSSSSSSSLFSPSPLLGFQSLMTIFQHSSVGRVIMVQDLSLDSPGRRLIRGSCTRWILMLMRERSREKTIQTHPTPANHRAPSVYTLRPVFCILSSELIQSRGPPGDFRCGEIVIAAADAASTSMPAPPRFYKRSFLDYGGGGKGREGRKGCFQPRVVALGKKKTILKPSPLSGIEDPGIGISAPGDVEERRIQSWRSYFYFSIFANNLE